jgi:hypothetical protein
MTTVSPPKLLLHKTEGPLAETHPDDTKDPEEAVSSPPRALL